MAIKEPAFQEGVLVARAWMDGEPPRLLIRVLTRVGTSDPVSGYASDEKTFNAVVTDWLRRLQRHGVHKLEDDMLTTPPVRTHHNDRIDNTSPERR